MRTVSFREAVEASGHSAAHVGESSCVTIICTSEFVSRRSLPQPAEQIPATRRGVPRLIWGRGDHARSKLSPKRPFTQRGSVVSELQKAGSSSVLPV